MNLFFIFFTLWIAWSAHQIAWAWIFNVIIKQFIVYIFFAVQLYPNFVFLILRFLQHFLLLLLASQSNEDKCCQKHSILYWWNYLKCFISYFYPYPLHFLIQQLLALSNFRTVCMLHCTNFIWNYFQQKLFCIF